MTDIQPREPGNDRRDNVVSAGLSPDTFEDFEQYRVSEGINNSSDALRRLIREGLGPDHTRREARTLALLGAVAYVGGYVTLGTTGGSVVGGSVILALLLWSFWPVIADFSP